MSMNVEKAYRLAAERYQEYGVDTEAALARLRTIPVSLHCWQGDDVRGFEQFGGDLGGGLAATGNYPGAARTPDELRADVAKALSLIPGRHRFNLHAFYGEFGGAKVDRDEIRPEHFARLDRLGEVARHRPRLQPDLLLASERRRQRDALARRRGDPGVLDPPRHRQPEDRRGHRPRARQTLRHQLLDPRRHEGHARGSDGTARPADRGARRDLQGPHRPRLQPGFGRRQAVRHRRRELHRRFPRVLPRLRAHAPGALHARHGPLPPDRDDHRQDQLRPARSCRRSCCTSAAASAGTATTSSSSTTTCEAIGQELVRGDYLARTHIGLDYFDASINRVAAWVIGARNMLKALLMALLEPIDQLRAAERIGRLHRPSRAPGGGEDAAVRRGLGSLLRALGRAGGRGVAGRRPPLRAGRVVGPDVLTETRKCVE